MRKMEQTTNKPKNIAYLRVSKEEENLENQKFAIQQFAKEDLIFFSDEDVSGSVSMRKRDSWAEMQEYIDKNKPERLYVFELSRLARDMEEGLSVIKELQEKVAIFSASPREQFLNQTDPMMRKLLTAIFLWFYDYELNTNKARTKAALEERKGLLKTNGSYVSKKSGKTVMRLGRIPWIYDRDPKTGDLSVNQERLAIAKRAIKMRYNGGSYDEIAKKLGISKDLARSFVKRKDFINKFP